MIAINDGSRERPRARLEGVFVLWLVGREEERAASRITGRGAARFAHRGNVGGGGDERRTHLPRGVVGTSAAFRTEVGAGIKCSVCSTTSGARSRDNPSAPRIRCTSMSAPRHRPSAREARARRRRERRRHHHLELLRALRAGARAPAACAARAAPRAPRRSGCNRRPMTSSVRTTPRPKRSLRPSSGSPRSCSGA